MKENKKWVRVNYVMEKWEFLRLNIEEFFLSESK